MSRLWLLLPVALAACTPAAPDPGVEQARAYIKEVTGDDLKVGGLHVRVNKAPPTAAIFASAVRSRTASPNG